MLPPTHNTIGSGWRRKERKGKERGKNSRIKGENYETISEKRQREIETVLLEWKNEITTST